MQKYTPTNGEGESWNVIDEYHAIVYENITKFEAQTVTEILNSGSALNWDAVSADWRWAVLVQIRQLAARLDAIEEKAQKLRKR